MAVIGVGDVVQVVECPSVRCGALSSSPRATQKKEQHRMAVIKRTDKTNSGEYPPCRSAWRFLNKLKLG